MGNRVTGRTLPSARGYYEPTQARSFRRAALLANYKNPEDLIGENGILKQLTKLLVERALDPEMTEHLGHDKHEPIANATGNTRNAASRRSSANFGELPIEIRVIATATSSRS